MDNQNCHCGKPAAGFKCKVKDCGHESDQHDASHVHDNVNTHQPKCSGCDQAKDNCVDCKPDEAAATM